jgi:hypothetical protein
MFRAALCLTWLAATCPAAAQVLDVRELDTRQIDALDRSHTVGGILEEHGPYLPAYSDKRAGRWPRRGQADCPRLTAGRTTNSPRIRIAVRRGRHG